MASSEARTDAVWYPATRAAKGSLKGFSLVLFLGRWCGHWAPGPVSSMLQRGYPTMMISVNPIDTVSSDREILDLREVKHRRSQDLQGRIVVAQIE